MKGQSSAHPRLLDVVSCVIYCYVSYDILMCRSGFLEALAAWLLRLFVMYGKNGEI